jgi:hypothetical protein
VVFVSRLNSPMIVGWDVEDEGFLRRCDVLQIRERISGRERGEGVVLVGVED